MMAPLRKNNTLIKIINNSLIDLPAPPNISYWWNFGSLLILMLAVQLASGVFLAMHYCPETTSAYSSISHIMRDVNFGWFMRYLHMNGASMFFILIYLHVSRGVYYALYKNTKAWTSGVLLLFLLMATAFLGYVLPWGQMSFWGATVITNLLSAIPYCGEDIVTWLWGGYSVDKPTLSRFFTLHFLLPFILMAMILLHIIFLHEKGSSNPLSLNSNLDKIPFHPYYSVKDILGMITLSTILLLLIFTAPNLLGDPENYNKANPLVTPLHIQPEWYFLFAYAVLRSIPNKLGGVLALAFSIAILFVLPLLPKKKFNSTKFYPLNKILFWYFINIVLILSWIGASPVETPFQEIGQIFTFLYFSYFMVSPLLMSLWDTLL